MALTTKDIITQDFVRNTVEEVVQEDLIYRDVFRELDASGIESNAYTFQIEDDNMGRPETIPEGAEFPRNQSTVREVTVNFEKYGDEVAVTMEAMNDGMLDLKAREVEDLAREMAEHLNDKAFEELDNNVDTTVGDGNDTLTFSDIRDGMVAVRQNNYTPDTLIVDLGGYGDLLTDSNFNRATDMGDEVVRSGQIGQIAGMDVIVDNTRDIGSVENSGDAVGAFVVDSRHYGYELTRTPITTNEYEDPERQSDVMQIYTRKAWKAIFSEAAVKVDA